MKPGEFSDAEVEAIFALALEKQGSAGEPGLTLAEVEDVGREVGLDPEAVRRAAVELSRESDDQAASVMNQVRTAQGPANDTGLCAECM